MYFRSNIKTTNKNEMSEQEKPKRKFLLQEGRREKQMKMTKNKRRKENRQNREEVLCFSHNQITKSGHNI